MNYEIIALQNEVKRLEHHIEAAKERIAVLKQVIKYKKKEAKQ